jgi:hypothetical protein
MDGQSIMKQTDIEKIVGQLSGKEGDFSIVADDSSEGSNRWKQLDTIARMMRDEPAVEAPAGLGDRVMARVRAHRSTLWQTLGEALLRPRTASFDPIKALRSPISGEECSFYFIVVGAFYAVLSIVLMIGFHMMGTTLAPPSWVRWQPQIAVVTALCMLAMGVYLLKDGKQALRVARIGALVYLGYGLLNGIVVSLEWDIPIAAFVSLLSTLIAVPTGFFLIRTIRNCGKRYA